MDINITPEDVKVLDSSRCPYTGDKVESYQPANLHMVLQRMMLRIEAMEARFGPLPVDGGDDWS